ncbi:MAG TPA: translocation/assembly module TamB domain-containing protein [Pyrinomonadaceae bacterium]|jgi:translocation and assembly module TamB
MPVDDRDERSSESSSPKTTEKEVKAALSTETDKPLPPAAERAAERDADRPEPVTPQGQRRRWLTRRNALLATLAVGVGIVAIILIAVIAYRLGYVDRYVANQIKNTLAQYGIRAEIKEFRTAFGPRTVEMKGIELYDQQTGEKLGQIERMLATVRIADLYALNLRRNINLQALEVDGLELWVKFDEQGNSNFRNLHLPPPDENARIKFSYLAANVKINSAVIHYGDERHDLSGEARNVVATIEPEDPNAPPESLVNRVSLSSTNSTLIFDGRPAINNIDIAARGRVRQNGAEIQELTLRSPLAQARLAGTLDDWEALRYQMQVTSNVDLTQASDILQTGASLRGTGNFAGTVSGEGTRYKVEGQIQSDALAADNVRLKALNVNLSGSGDGKAYEANGRAVAEVLTAGDFQLNTIQLTGKVMGTGTDFRWIGELRAAAARTPGGTIAGLILSDATAELREEELTASAQRATASGLITAGASASSMQVTDIRIRSANGTTTATAASAQVGTLTTSGARVSGVTASGVDVIDRDGTTNVTVNQLRVGGINASGATVGTLNVAGVRLAIRGGRLQGTSGDINVGTIALAAVGGRNPSPGGRIDAVRLARPTFTVEPSGSYRVSADLSLGGGVVGQVNLGSARASLVATNTQVQLNNFNANIFNGQATGNAVVSTTRGGTSHVAANFSNLDIDKLLALQSGRVVPITGQATGTIDLSFPGTNVSAATGNVRAEFNAEAGSDQSARTPLTGDVALRARSGLFQIERANLRTAASSLEATGQFSFVGNDSNLQVALNSTDAIELQNVLASTGLLSDLEAKLDEYNIRLGSVGASEFEQSEASRKINIALAGKLTFNGNVRGNLNDPSVDGQAAIDSLVVNNQDLGALSASLNLSPTDFRVTEGRLAERDGGGIQFALSAPRVGENNISIDATLERANASTLAVVLPASGKDGKRILNPEDIQSDVSGNVNVKGLPGAMSGVAELRFGAGRIKTEPFESILARATFSGSTVNLENLDARLQAGRVSANGTYDTGTQAFNLTAQATDIQLLRLGAFAGDITRLPLVTGTVNLNARASGKLDDFTTYDINFDGEGRDVTINGRPAGTLTLVGRTQNKQLDVRFTTGILGQPQVVAAQIDLSKESLPATIETTFNATDLTPLFATLMPQSNVKVTGRATGTLRATGNLAGEDSDSTLAGLTLAGLQGTANFTELNVQIEDVQLSAVSPLLVQFSTKEVFFERTQFTGPGTNVTFGGTAALGPGGRQNLTIDGKLNLRVLSGLSPDLFPSGAAEVAIRLGGTFERPRVMGMASVTGASFSLFLTDQSLTVSNVTGRIRFDANRAQIETLTGNLGGGSLTVTGGALLDGFRPSRFQFNIRGDDVVVPYPEDFRTTADADLEIKGTVTREQTLSIISGTVNVRRAEYTKDIDLANLINNRSNSLIEQGGELSFAATAQFNGLRVEGRDALVVRNNLADMVGSISLRVNGPVNEPVISGRITATRGTFEFRNETYEITRAFIDLPPSRDIDPLLNIQAEAEIRGYDVIVTLTGPLSQPTATTRSDPSLPQADVVALILTGNLSTNETTGSPLSGQGVGTAASLLTDALINDPARRATDKLFGLNRFEIDPLIAGRGGASPTARLTVGRQINKNLSITYSTNVTSDQNQVLAVEYRVSNRLSFIAQYEQGSVTGFSSRNDNFSFEIRFRKRF